MRVTEHRYGDVALLDVDGKLTVPDAGELLERAVCRLARDGLRVVIASLQNVSAVDAGGIGAMLAAYRASVRHRVAFRLVHVPRRVQHVISITGLAGVLEAFDSLEAALAISTRVSPAEHDSRTHPEADSWVAL